MSDTTPNEAPVHAVRFGRRAWLAVVVLLAVIAALMCWRHLRDGRPHASLGATVPATGPLGPTTSSSVLLPSGRLDVRATKPLEDVSSDPALNGTQAPEDGSFVGLQIAAADEPSVTRWTFGDTTVRGPVTPDFVLVADGRRYPVTQYDPYDREVDDNEQPAYGRFVAQRVYVAIAGRPERLELEVTYAGAKQTVDLRTGARNPGRFAALYANKAVDLDCGTATWQTGFAAEFASDRECRVDLVQRTPYYPVHGWAPAGRTWVVVGVDTLQPAGLRYRAGNRLARYELFGLPKVTVTLDGVAAKGTGLYSSVSSSRRHDVSLFSVPDATGGDRVGVSVAYDASVRSDSVPVSRDYSAVVKATWSVALP